MSGRDTRILMKLVVDGSTDRVVGCHIVGDPAERRRQERAGAALAARPRRWRHARGGLNARRAG